MMERGVRFVVFRYGHHSPHSGYSRLAEFGLARFKGDVLRVDKPLSRRIVRERLLWRLARGVPGYDRASMAAELKVAWRMLSEPERIYHFLYGETTYRYVGALNNFRRNRVVATFHLPPSGMRAAVQIDQHVRQLSAVVCVGRSQQEFFRNKVDSDRVFFAPLGVDTEYFTPPPSFDARASDRIVVVGENYRDYPTLRGVIELVAYLRPAAQFVMVASARSLKLVGPHPNLIIRSGLPESELRDLYRSATLMVMPLLDATANNAILEGMACGIPLVVSDVGSIRDYVDPGGAAIVRPSDARCMAEAIVELLDSPSERERMATRARDQALAFSWPKVVELLDTVYSAVA